VRLAIVAFLAGAGTADFGAVREAITTTDGNASVHLRELEDAGYIAANKRFVALKPQTRYALTDSGHKPFFRLRGSSRKPVGVVQPF
jgi:DNA-binding transcriptional ArsR family regulator